MVIGDSVDVCALSDSDALDAMAFPDGWVDDRHVVKMSVSRILWKREPF